ncbi:radical SAM family heme chaperone HemW [bacterium]|nr:radical SAM family heme chaperone HemW [bacterium]
MTQTGIYIHIPFCRVRCHYCDFYSHGDALGSIPMYVDAVCREINLYAGRINPAIITSIYLGGGTPSLLSIRQIHMILHEIKTRFRCEENPEISIEANPGTIDAEYLTQLSLQGINRLSLGIQSFCDRELTMLGRIHSADEAREAFQSARSAGFKQIGIDLIYGLPGQNVDQWQRSLKEAIALSPEHISAYALTWNDDTETGRRIECGDLPRPEEEMLAQQYQLAVTMLENAGYEHYEVSNFARSGCRARHNAAYWTGRPYLGLGASAHGYLPPVRYWNISDIDQYVHAIKDEKLPLAGSEELRPDQERIEQIALGLRTSEGISRQLVSGNIDQVETFIEAGWLKEQGTNLIPTSSGMFQADGMAASLI